MPKNTVWEGPSDALDLEKEEGESTSPGTSSSASTKSSDETPLTAERDLLSPAPTMGRPSKKSKGSSTASSTGGSGKAE